jgi:hypothetical protein
VKVKVQPYVSAYGDQFYGIYVKRWWLPIWVKVDFWSNREAAVMRAKLIKHPETVVIE